MKKIDYKLKEKAFYEKNYNFFQRILHDITLGNKFVKKSLYEIEKIIYLKKTEIQNQKHIFITGLPRSGTTILLSFLYSSNNFCSLKYSNMPFIMAPNISRLFQKKNFTSQERYHKDGIMFDLNSPEAFDEVFFSSFDTSGIKNEFLNYIQLVLQYENNKRYLSKNNSNYKRIDIILSLLPNSLFIIPIREPLQHSYSLLTQNYHFYKLQRRYDFARRYMNYLGLHAFGINHIPWNKPDKYNDYKNINYWLEQWILFYKYIYENYSNYSNCKFVVYEKLINEGIIDDLKNFVEINYSNHFKFVVSHKNISLNYDEELYNEAKKIYLKF
jgi:hypothetical protein